MVTTEGWHCAAPLRIIKENPLMVTDPVTDRHIHPVTSSHLKVGQTLYNASLCCDYTTISPTPNWQAPSAGSTGDRVWGRVLELEWGRVRDNSRVHKNWLKRSVSGQHHPPLPRCRSLPPTETSISSPQPDSRSVSPPAHSLHTVSEGWFSLKQTV